MHVRIEGKASIEEAVYCTIYDASGDEREVLGSNGREVGILYKANADPIPIKIHSNQRTKTNPSFKQKPESRAAA